MPKRFLINIIISLLILVNFHTPAAASVQAGVEVRVDKERATFATTKFNWWFKNNWSLSGKYYWSDGDLDLGFTGKIKPDAPSSFYWGIEARDVNAKIAPNLDPAQKVMLIAGVEFELSRLKPGLSLTIEAAVNPNEFHSQISGDQSNPGPGSYLGISLNYRLPGPKTSAGKEYSADCYLLAKLITAEAPGEPYDGQVAVAAVVLNRVRSNEFPDTVAAVIYEPGQFSTINKLSRIIPTEMALNAAKSAIEGNDPSRGALYFYNPATASAKARNYIKYSHFQVTARIGRHVFYK